MTGSQSRSRITPSSLLVNSKASVQAGVLKISPACFSRGFKFQSFGYASTGTCCFPPILHCYCPLKFKTVNLGCLTFPKQYCLAHPCSQMFLFAPVQCPPIQNTDQADIYHRVPIRPIKGSGKAWPLLVRRRKSPLLPVVLSLRGDPIAWAGTGCSRAASLFHLQNLLCRFPCVSSLIVKYP